MLKKIKEKILWILLFAVIFSLGIATNYFYSEKNQANISSTKIKIEENIYTGFLSEIYDKIRKNYWEKITDEQLGNLFKLGIEKLIDKPQTFKIKNKDDFRKMLIEIMKIVKEDKKKEFTTQLAHIVLQNLQPLGRSSLYAKKDEEDLSNKVRNINPETNQIEPTVFAKLVRPNILHLYIKKISPNTFEELKTTTEKINNIDSLDTLILDLRANVGGSIDALPYLMGPFIGKDQYAFEFFHQEEYTPFKTQTGWLPSLIRYKKVIILVDNQTQSSAEVLAATLKKYNVGILIGTTTKGWGTIEAVMNLENQIDPNEKYSIFLVHSLTLRDDNQPIESNGVDPTININDHNWEQQLFSYFHYDDLIETVKEIWNKTPQ